MAKGKKVLQWLIDGKKIRCVSWFNEAGYIVLRDNQLLEEHNSNAHGYWDFFNSEWELYEEPERERSLLSAVK